MTGRVGRVAAENPFSAHRVQPGALAYQLPGGVAELAARLDAAGGRGEIVGPHGSGKSTLLASLFPVLVRGAAAFVTPPTPSPSPRPSGPTLSPGGERVGGDSSFPPASAPRSPPHEAADASHPLPPGGEGRGEARGVRGEAIAVSPGADPRWTVRVVRLSTSLRTLPPDLFPLAGPRPLLVIDGFEQVGWFARRRVVRTCRAAGAGLLVTSHRPTGLPPLWRTDVTPAALAWVLAELLPTDDRGVLNGFDPAARLRACGGSLRDVLFELYDRWETKRPPG